MERERIIKALECCSKLVCDECPNKDESPCTQTTATDALSLIKELTEDNAEVKANWQKLKESHESACEECRAEFKRLTEENERLRGVCVPDNEVYIRLSDAKHAIMDYIGEQTVSKYASSAECKAARYGAEGAMNELDYLTPVNVAPIADTVRKMHSEIKERCIKGGIYPAFVANTIDQITKEMLENN